MPDEEIPPRGQAKERREKFSRRVVFVPFPPKDPIDRENSQADRCKMLFQFKKTRCPGDLGVQQGLPHVQAKWGIKESPRPNHKDVEEYNRRRISGGSHISESTEKSNKANGSFFDAYGNPLFKNTTSPD